jgi:hypothetical protein
MRREGLSKILTDLILLCVLGAFLLMLMGCGKLPDFPETLQCAYSHSNQLFICVNTKTKAKVRLRADDPWMKNAQCVSLDDYKAGQTWVQTVKRIAERRCK